MPRHRLQIRGVVQGVGFRPFVYRIALEHGLGGWVRNRPDGVELEVQGPLEALGAFAAALRNDKPAPARIEGIETLEIPEVVSPEPFHIRESGEGARRPTVPADLATCAACLAEVSDPAERRYRYPFTNCTHCGPRYSIIEALPYDRPRTSMKAFPLCAACGAEYGAVRDRRFHAQPVACATCGPTLELVDTVGGRLAMGDAALRGAVAALGRGEVLALKGLGGYQLLVDATDGAAVARLRERKRREEKPFAVMFPDLEGLQEACAVSAEERALLEGPEAPIVLLPRRPESVLAPNVAPGNPRIGAFLPYTPLHHLLLRDLGRPVVCTSGNLSEEPMATEDEEALERLGRLADAFLRHDRPIVRPVDDSVLRLDAQGPTLLRRARGYAPLAVPVPWEGPPVLALGAHQKATVALLFDGQALVSQHLGDLGSLESAALLARTVEDLLAFYRVRPGLLACDLHPDYASTRLAEALAVRFEVPLVRVQHHHAHAAAVMAEHDLEGPVLALTWDGTGLGTDGTVWGGEALRVDRRGCSRIGHLKAFPLPGGEAASRDPRRSALGLVLAAQGGTSALGWLPEGERSRWETQARKGLNAPLTSGLGRLFDAVAALCGVRRVPGYEGQAAMALEWASDPEAEAYPWAWDQGVADPAPLVQALLEDVSRGLPLGRMGGRFHAALGVLALGWAERAGLPDVVLGGGCFQNALLLATVHRRLTEAGYRVHLPRRFPPNDGAISLGQAAVAAWTSPVPYLDARNPHEPA